jgi:hypothetical protein
MRTLLVLTGVLLLAGCGGNSEDFSVDVAMSPDQAHAQLAQLDGGLLLSALSLPKVTATQSGTEGLSFTLPGQKEAGELVVRLEAVGTNMTRVHVALDMPMAMRMVDGAAMVVIESKAEAELKSRFESWAKAVSGDGSGSIDQVNLVVGALSLALYPDKLNELQSADGEELARLIDPAAMSGMFGSEDGGSASDYAPLDQPMDPGAGGADAAGPMDFAQGESAEGEDPTPDLEPVAY